MHHVTCHVSLVTCRWLYVDCINLFIFFFFKKVELAYHVSLYNLTMSIPIQAYIALGNLTLNDFTLGNST